MYAGRVVSDFRQTVGYIHIHMIRGGFANTDIACKMCWLVVSNIRINGRYKRCWAKVTMFILAAGCYGTRKCFGTSFGWAALPRGIMQRKQMQCIHVFIFWIFDLEDMLANHVCVVFIHLYYPAIDIYEDMWEQKWQLCCELNLKTPLSWRLAWPGVFGSKHNILCCPSGNLRLELLKWLTSKAATLYFAPSSF